MTRQFHPTKLQYQERVDAKLTHYLFRYPAKFHPPVARSLIEQFSEPGDWVLDPFCGSGTLLVEAAICGRNAIGTDYDPVAVFVSDIKTRRFDVSKLSRHADELLSELTDLRRPDKEYEERQWLDLTQDEYQYETESESLWVPEIPNLHHWFRNYVIVDLARILRCIATLGAPEAHKDFMRLCFASILRASSKADPVPVSGLEVTSFMREKDRRGRLVNPFELFQRQLTKALNAVDDYTSTQAPNCSVLVTRCDATQIASRVCRLVDCVITSPPYQSAVDYYRRHQLEMYWLGFTRTQQDRKRLIPNYIGRSNVSNRHPFLQESVDFGPIGVEWKSKLEGHSKQRSKAFTHYVVSMTKFFAQLTQVIRIDGKVVIVIGNSKSNGLEIPTADMLPELASPNYELVDRMWYPLKDKYMSYSRRNGANIDTEHVLVFARKSK